MSLPHTSNLLAEKWSTAQFLFDLFLKYWRRNTNITVFLTKSGKLKHNTRNPVWQPLCTYVRRGNKYNYDLHWLDPNSSPDGTDGVSFYVTKYLLKYDEWIDKFKSKLYFNLSHEDYKSAWGKFRPRCLMSKGFGSPRDPLVAAHICKGINFALADTKAFFPYYISRINGSTYPLSPFYSKKFLTPDAQLVFCSRRPDDILTIYDIDDFDKRQIHLDAMRSYLLSQSSAFDYDDIDDINTDNLLPYECSRNSQSDSDFADCWQDT